jgi:hypothetical protein
LCADTITLITGAQIQGSVESGTAREIRVLAGGRVQLIPLERVKAITFDADAPTPAAEIPNLPAAPAPKPVARAGAELVVRTIERIESKKADKKREYHASLDQPLIADGFTLAPANSEALLKVTQVKNAKVKGKSSLSLQVVALVVNGKRIPVRTEDVSSESGSQGKRTAVGAGAGAGVGAGIGGVAGGGAGAAAGAAVGAATGTAAAVLFGQTVKIEPETRFTFRLTQDVTFE